MLKFKCPECGGNKIEIVENTIAVSEITEIKEDGNFEYGPVDNIDGETSCYQCSKCGFVITDEDGNDISDNESLVDWIKENCDEEQN